jgi:hypothetical protein
VQTPIINSQKSVAKYIYYIKPPRSGLLRTSAQTLNVSRRPASTSPWPPARRGLPRASQTIVLVPSEITSCGPLTTTVVRWPMSRATSFRETRRELSCLCWLSYPY